MYENDECEMIFVREGGVLHQKIRKCCHGSPFEENMDIRIPLKRRKHDEPYESTSASWKSTLHSSPQLSIRSLFTIALDFITEHFDQVESLVGFPSSIGEIIFKQLWKKLNVKRCSESLRYVFHIFAEAYGDAFLICLQSRNAPNEVNTYLDLFVSVMPHLVELDLSFCHLGHDHDLLIHIAHSLHLTRLNLQGNYLSDASIRRLCLPSVMFHRGPVHLREFDLSYNRITENCLHHLKCFEELEYLNLSGNKIEDEKKVSTTLKLKVVSSYETEEIKSKGWAAHLMNFILRNSDDTTDLCSEKSRFYGLKRLKRSKSRSNLKFERLLILIKEPSVEKTQEEFPPMPSSSHMSPSFNTDEELMSMYSSNATNCDPLPTCLWESFPKSKK